MQNPKYSIIIPSRNGGKYLPYCVNTIINQKYDNYELILSDDNSTDETGIYLSSITHPKIRIIHPPEGLSMAEHWEWALSHAQGEWLMFVGQDDGLQTYFFQLADRLTEIAGKKNLRTIMSERALFFWKDSGFYYGNAAIRYRAKASTKINSSRFGAIKALLGLQSYFFLPSMYTTSLFHRDIICEAKDKQQGRLFVTHPQDANLAAIACSLEKKYLMSYVPLGWVGSSKKSAGMAIRANEPTIEMQEESNNISSLKKEYVEKVCKSELEYNFIAGDFQLGNLDIYFWQALLQTKNLRGPALNKILMSKFLRILMFCRVLNEVNRSKNSDIRLKKFQEILKRNRCNYFFVKITSILTFILAGAFLLASRLLRKVIRLLSNHIDYDMDWSDNEQMDILKASSQVSNLIRKKKILNNSI
jgi:glycosyltransferase involved in cell wall biosynthesis